MDVIKDLQKQLAVSVRNPWPASLGTGHRLHNLLIARSSAAVDRFLMECRYPDITDRSRLSSTDRCIDQPGFPSAVKIVLASAVYSRWDRHQTPGVRRHDL